MIVLGYVGNHSNDTFLVRAGWAITRLVQRGEFEKVTHVEACFGFSETGCAHIGSSSLRDDGVRTKHVFLTNNHWAAIDVPVWDADKSLAFIKAQSGGKYDTRGALATVLLGAQDGARWFCNEIVGASVGLVSPEIYGPAQFMAIAASMPGAKIVDLPKHNVVDVV
jgi:hypothetical protein